MSKIFISYRRVDSQNATGRILDRLKDVFKTEEVFMDVESIPQGINFLEFSRKRLEDAEIVVAIVGKNWAKSLIERENDPNDFVRIEIEEALASKVPILPVYVDDAKSPGPVDLPLSIQNFSYFNGITVRPNPDFENDISKVIEAIKKIVSPKAIKRQNQGKTTWFDRIKYMLLGIVVIVSVLFYLNRTKECKDLKTGILIANFQDIEHDGFSNSILTQIQKVVADSIYDIHTVGYQPRNRENYEEYVKTEFFENSCTPQGMFVNGFLSREQSVFNLYTSLVNLEVKLPDFITDRSLVLANPSEITFSIKEDATYISNLLITIIRILEGNASDALKKINELEKVKIEDKEVKALLAFLKGQCYAIHGDERRATAAFRKAKNSDNIHLSNAAEHNISMSHRISQEYQKTEETSKIRQQNVEEHSKFEKELDKVLKVVDQVDRIEKKLPMRIIDKILR